MFKIYGNYIFAIHFKLFRIKNLAQRPNVHNALWYRRILRRCLFILSLRWHLVVVIFIKNFFGQPKFWPRRDDNRTNFAYFCYGWWIVERKFSSVWSEKKRIIFFWSILISCLHIFCSRTPRNCVYAIHFAHFIIVSTKTYSKNGMFFWNNCKIAKLFWY